MNMPDSIVWIIAIANLATWLCVAVAWVLRRRRAKQRIADSIVRLTPPQAMLARWDDFYHSQQAHHENLETADWESMAIGFFIALGADVEMATALAEQYTVW